MSSEEVVWENHNLKRISQCCLWVAIALLYNNYNPWYVGVWKLSFSSSMWECICACTADQLLQLPACQSHRSLWPGWKRSRDGRIKEMYTCTQMRVSQDGIQADGHPVLLLLPQTDSPQKTHHRLCCNTFIYSTVPIQLCLFTRVHSYRYLSCTGVTTTDIAMATSINNARTDSLTYIATSKSAGNLAKKKKKH